MKKRTRPPKRSRILLKTSLSKTACCTLSRNGTGLPSRWSASYLETDRERPVEELLLQAALGLLHRLDPAVRLLEDARRGTHERRLHDREVVDDLVDAAVDGGREADRELRGQQHLAERVRHRQPEELQVVLGEDVVGLDDRAFVGPGVVAQPDALGPAGGAGGVDQGGEGVGADVARDPVDLVGLRRPGACRRASPGRRGRSPSRRRRRPSKVTTFETCGSSSRCSMQLRDLVVVLGEDHAAVGVGEDEGDVLGVGRRVDGGGGGAGAHDRRGRRGSTRSGCWRRCRPAARARRPERAGRRRAGVPGRRPAPRSATTTSRRPSG